VDVVSLAVELAQLGIQLGAGAAHQGENRERHDGEPIFASPAAPMTSAGLPRPQPTTVATFSRRILSDRMAMA
jgi:hypothetical protein